MYVCTKKKIYIRIQVVSRASMRVKEAGALQEVQGYVFEVEETGVSPDAPETEGMCTCLYVCCLHVLCFWHN